MKKTILTAALLFGLGTFFMTSCGPDDGGTTTSTPTKTVDKTKLVNDGWYEKGQSGYTHRFYSNGNYNDIGGTWEWLNNSDSMKVVTSSLDNLTLTAHFVYITDTEMAFKTGKTTNATEVFKSSPW